MSVAIEAWNLHVSNVCQCAKCPDCDVWYENADYEQACEECGAVMESIDCGGICWEDYQTLAQEIVQMWMYANKASAYYISGSDMGWLHQSGHTDIETDPAKALELLSINTAWLLEFALKDDRLTVVRRSHDELGASFEFMTIPNDGICDCCQTRTFVKQYGTLPDYHFMCDFCKEDHDA